MPTRSCSCAPPRRSAEAAPYVWGTALHWYQSTDDVGIPVIEKLRERHPTKSIMHTEGCIDVISAKGNRWEEGVFLGWANDAWWWNEGAIDWGYDWAPPEQKPDDLGLAPGGAARATER